MAHRRTPQADSGLDEIWYLVASRSGSLYTADGFIDSIANRLFLLGRQAEGFSYRYTIRVRCQRFA